MGKLKLLKYTPKDIYHERIQSALRALDTAEDEYAVLEEIAVALEEFFGDIDHELAEQCRIEIIKLRGLIESLYNDF